MSSSYVVRQTVRDSEYKQAWDKAPETFKQAAARRGIKPLIENPSGAMEFDDNHRTASYKTDMADVIDTFVDCLVEKHGVFNEEVVRSVAADLKKPMDLEIERNRALSLGRMLFFLARSETRNLKASVYAAMHAIPRLAGANGMSSMRQSARECGVSAEWMRRSRDEVCKILEIPIPEEGRKSLDARIKYAKNGNLNHWRKQIIKKGIDTNGKSSMLGLQKEPILCKTQNAKHRNPKPQSALLLAMQRHSASQRTES